MKEETKQRAKDTIPWAAIVVAVLGWYDAREEGKAAQDKARTAKQEVTVAAEEAKQFADNRTERSWEWVQAEFAKERQRIDDLEGWVFELEGFVEEHVEGDSPRTRREKEARQKRLEAIRKKRRERQFRTATKRILDTPLPDYNTAQKQAPPPTSLPAK